MLPAPAALDILPFCNLVIHINSDYILSGPRPQNSQLKTKGQCKLMIIKGNAFDIKLFLIFRRESETLDNNNERRVLDTSRLLGQELIL